MKKDFSQNGQILIETLLAILIAAIVIGAAASLTVVSQKSGWSSGNKGAAISLAEEGIEALGAIADSDWHNIYWPPSGSAGNPKEDLADYYVSKSGSSWILSSNSADGEITVNGIAYTRKIRIYNVYRSGAADGDREIIPGGGPGTMEDPSTQKVKVTISYAGGQDTVIEQYLTRWKNNTFVQTDWSGGGGQAGPILNPNSMYDSDDGNIETNNPPGSIKLKQ